MYKDLLKEIKLFEKIIIHRHKKPDGDALGSQMGLAHLIRDNFDDKKVMIVGSKTEFEKTSLKNIFKDKFDNPTDDDYKDALVIVVDTANVERIEGDNFFKGKLIYKVDHHASAEKFGDKELILNKISSTAQIISTFAAEAKLTISKKAAEYLLTGMITDTGRFMFNSVDSKTFEQVINLMDAGAKIYMLVNSLNDRNINFIRLQGEVLSNFKIKNGVAYYMMPKGLHKKYGVDYGSASSMVFLLMMANEVKYALFSSYDSKDKVWKASLRSRAKAINKIAEKHNGGGHNMAAGLKIKDKKEFNIVVNELLNLK